MLGLNFTLTRLVAAMKKASAYSPATLFASGEQGAWYDPSDLSTLFQDSAGTTPVTALEQPVGLMLDKSGKGNHATQPTATSRPVVSARVSLLTKTEQFDDAVWARKTNVTITPNAITSSTGTNTGTKLEATATVATELGIDVVSIPAGEVQFSFEIKKGSSATVMNFIQVRNQSAGVNLLSGQINLDTGGITYGIGSSGISSVFIGDGWWRVTAKVVLASSVTLRLSIGANGGTVTGGEFSYIWGADLRVANDGVNLPPYQRVNTATDYDSVGFPVYLRADGVDDGMVTNSINFTATDKMTVVAGVRKLSDGVIGIFAELSGNSDSSAGSFLLAAPVIGKQYYFQIFANTRIDGTVDVGYAAPRTDVVTEILDIAGATAADEVKARVNGSALNLTYGAGVAAGTGNFGNYPLYLFRRGGSSFPFNGRFYGMTVVNKLLSTAELEQLETYTNGKTRAFA